jgi:sensor histidine kinase YesM
MKNSVLYLIVLLMTSLIFALILTPVRGGEFYPEVFGDHHLLESFCTFVIFFVAIGFTIKILAKLFSSLLEKKEIHIRILFSAPIFFIGTLVGFIIANLIFLLLFGSCPLPIYCAPFSFSFLIKISIAGTMLASIVEGGIMFKERCLELQKEKEVTQLQAKIKVLQTQLNPRFFFDSLASVQSLIYEKPRIAEETLAAVSEIFRYSLRRGQKDFIKLEEEINLIKRYLFIEETRLRSDIKITWEVDEELLDCLIPPFIIHPLVENAVEHEVAENKKGKIQIAVKEKDGKINISVSNTGRAKVRFIPEHSLYNIKQRIKVLYGDRGSFKIKTNGEVRIEILIPRRTHSSSNSQNQ